MNRLVQIKAIYRHQSEYKFINPFFKLWFLWKIAKVKIGGVCWSLLEPTFFLTPRRLQLAGSPFKVIPAHVLALGRPGRAHNIF